MNQFLILLLSLSAGGAIITGFLLLGERLFGKKVTRVFTYYAWLAVLLRLCIPFGIVCHLLPNDWSVSQFVPSPDPATFTLVELYGMPDQGSNHISLPNPSRAAGTVELTGPATLAAHETISSNDEPAGSSAPTWGLLKKAHFWLAVWALGVIVFMWRYLWNYRKFIRALRQNLLPADDADIAVFAEWKESKRVTLQRSSSVAGPVLVGLLRPMLVLPAAPYVANGKEDALRDVLRHELIHYRRRDLYYAWFTALASCLHWFNPIMPLVRRKINNYRELACDEAVLRSLTSAERQRYGETLLNQAGASILPTGAPITGICESKIFLKERLLSIRDYRPRTIVELAISALLALFLIVSTSVMAGEVNRAEPYPIPVTAQEAMESLTGSILLHLSPGGESTTPAFQFMLPDYENTADFRISITGHTVAEGGGSLSVAWFDEYENLWAPGVYTFCPNDWQKFSDLVFTASLAGAKSFRLDLLSLYQQIGANQV